MPAFAGMTVASRRLFDKADRWFARTRAALLEALPCRAGCHDCCLGLFAVTVLDRRHLQEGLSQLPDDVRRRIETRANAQVAQLEQAFPDLASRPFLDDWPDEVIDRLVSAFAKAPCPALDQAGCCSIYAHRPLTCRLMGVPTQAGDVAQPACEVQTALPLIPVSEILRKDEEALAAEEARCLEEVCADRDGEEILLPYAFLRDRRVESRSSLDSARNAVVSWLPR